MSSLRQDILGTDNQHREQQWQRRNHTRTDFSQTTGNSRHPISSRPHMSAEALVASGSRLADVPAALPAPQQDGAAKHLIGHPLPVLVELPCTRLHLDAVAVPGSSSSSSSAVEERRRAREVEHNDRGYVDLFNTALSRPVLLFIYPRTATPTEVIPDSWNSTPGARGCTPHLLSIPSLLSKMRELEPELEVFGLSAQSPAEQQEAADRLRLPFRLLSDEKGELRDRLELPEFEWEGRRWLKRTTLYLRESQCVNLNYPIFPSDTAAERALEMLAAYKEPTT